MDAVQQAASGHLGMPMAITVDDIKRFRELGSRCPGHPEYHLTTGVETTTGPLGQGCATSVGRAIAQRWLATRFDRPSSRYSITTSIRYADLET
jgi:transketolase